VDHAGCRLNPPLTSGLVCWTLLFSLKLIAAINVASAVTQANNSEQEARQTRSQKAWVHFHSWPRSSEIFLNDSISLGLLVFYMEPTEHNATHILPAYRTVSINMIRHSVITCPSIKPINEHYYYYYYYHYYFLLPTMTIIIITINKNFAQSFGLWAWRKETSRKT
jgi:hypothetical protein